jgi:hypothetical protein
MSLSRCHQCHNRPNVTSHGKQLGLLYSGFNIWAQLIRSSGNPKIWYEVARVEARKVNRSIERGVTKHELQYLDAQDIFQG